MANVYNSQLDAFDLYHQNRESSSPNIGPALPALGHALAGSTGTAVSSLAIYPLDLIITRLQVQRSLRRSSSTPNEGEYKGVVDAFKQIYKKEGGISAFYTGVLQDTGKSIADSFLFFLFYNYLRSRRLQKHGTKATTLPLLDELTVGALAGACSKFFTTPISNIVTRKQTSSMISARTSSPTSSPSVSDIAQSIRSEKGLQGFWSGYSASLVLTLNPSITFFLYEFFKRAFLPRAQRDDPGARLTFLMAAVSKSIASTITYPFSLAKARAQASSSPPIDTDSAEEVKGEVEHALNKTEAEKAGKDAKKVVKRRTVFGTILKIYRTEGASALYEGIWGEILKGFFSHGITMIVKESIHKLIIQAYYIILKALDKYPSPSELATQTEVAIQDAGE
ncbi:putative peroxisomal adenine nucleotide transporter 1, partial [Hyaloscypha sp. PMI_1271]